MTALTIQETSRRSGLSEPTLRYYEEIGMIGPIARDGEDGEHGVPDELEDLAPARVDRACYSLEVAIEDRHDLRRRPPDGSPAGC